MKIIAAISLALLCLPFAANADQPAWCRDLPRPAYKTVHRVPISGSWFEVYEVSHTVYAIYEPHQSQETIGYLIVGNKRALLFDTGMGIGNVKQVVTQLTSLPIAVLNSHTHHDHVGGNWQFDTVYGMDTEFTRHNAEGSSKAAQAEIAPSEICGDLPPGFNRSAYATRPWKITRYVHDGEQIDLGGRSLQVLATPGHTPDAITLFDRANGLLFTGDTYYPGTIWLFNPETDVAAYAASVHRLARLAPQVQHVLGAHNFPLASPSILPALAAAFDQVRAGKVRGIPEEKGKALYKVNGLSFLMRAPE